MDAVAAALDRVADSGAVTETTRQRAQDYAREHLSWDATARDLYGRLVAHHIKEGPR